MFVYYKRYISIELPFLKELILIKQLHQKSVIFVTIVISKSLVLSFNQTSAIDLLMMSMNLSDIAILNIKGSDYRCIISLISKNEPVNLMQNADLTEKSGIL